MKRMAHTLAQAVDGKQAQEIGIPQKFQPILFRWIGVKIHKLGCADF